ncbi:MAG TPA: hypothetical protein VFM18_24630 [Methanosarcina sp.]|nr:hypothetical protein [Methanosarcina sp.]
MSLQNNPKTQVSDPDSNTGVVVETKSGPVIAVALGNYANDSAAATGGVPLGGLYRNGSVLMVRVA